MREVCSLIWLALVGAFRSRVSLEAENMILRHQLNVLRRPTFEMLDRLIFAGLYRLAPGKRCTGLARRRSRRAHSLSPNLGRTASPICPDLIYDRHRFSARRSPVAFEAEQGNSHAKCAVSVFIQRDT